MKELTELEKMKLLLAEPTFTEEEVEQAPDSYRLEDYLHDLREVQGELRRYPPREGRGRSVRPSRGETLPMLCSSALAG